MNTATSDEKALEEYILAIKGVDLNRRSVASYALEFLKTREANAEHYRTLLNLQEAAKTFAQACEYLKSSQQWFDKSVESIKRIDA